MAKFILLIPIKAEAEAIYAESRKQRKQFIEFLHSSEVICSRHPINKQTTADFPSPPQSKLKM